MSLDPSVLTDGFADIGQPQEASDAAASVALIYQSYAKSAVDPAGNKLLAGNTTMFATALIRWLSAKYPTADSAAEAFAYAIAQFWFGAEFETKILPAVATSGGSGRMAQLDTSVVTDVHTTRLETAITNLNLTGLQTVEAACASFAQALHSATITGVYVKMSGRDASGIPTIFLGNPS